jgi:hypothetical protein
MLLPQSFAATTHYQIRGQVSGSPVTDADLGFFEFDINKSRSAIHEVLPSGVKHNRYDFDLYEPVILPPVTKYDYRIYNEDNGGIFLSPHGEMQDFNIDQYLNPDGSSSLSIHGNAVPGCHGGCRIEEEFSLSYTSAGSGLFANLANPLSFEALSSATGKSVSTFISFVPVSQTFRTVTDFTIASTVSVVPEMDAWIFLLGGLVFGVYYWRRKTSMNPDIALARGTVIRLVTT